MKKLYSTIKMLAIMIAALGLTACPNNDNDDEDVFGISENEESLIIDDVALVPKAYIKENSIGGMYLLIYAHENAYFPKTKITFELYIGRMWVSELEVGDTFNEKQIYIENLESTPVIALYEKGYRIISGSITVLAINSNSVKLKFNDLKFALKFISNIYGEESEPKDPKVHTVSGTATFLNNRYRNGEYLPFGSK